jgi:hypothetical protein
MAKPAKRAGRPSKNGAARTTWVVRPPDLLTRFQDQAKRGGYDVSELLCRLAEQWLARRKGGQ